MEAFVLSAVQQNIVPIHEHLLQGSVLESARDMLLNRLQGLCDNVENTQEHFHDHEMVYSIRGGASPLTFRVRRSILHPDMPYHLRYVGNPDMAPNKSRHTVVRSCVDVGTSDNVVQFLTEVGFRLDYEYVAKGHLFRKGRMKIMVYKLYRITQSGNADAFEPMTSSCVVELSVVATSTQDQVQDDMKNFAEQLKPLVHVEKIDYNKLLQTTS